MYTSITSCCMDATRISTLRFTQAALMYLRDHMLMVAYIEFLPLVQEAPTPGGMHPVNDLTTQTPCFRHCHAVLIHLSTLYAMLHFPCPCSKGNHDYRNSSLFMPPYAMTVMFFKCHHSSSLVGKWKSHDRGGTGIPSQKFQRRFNSMTMIAHLNALSVVL